MEIKVTLRTDATARDVVSLILDKVRNAKRLGENAVVILDDQGNIVATVVVNQIEDGLTEITVKASKYTDVLDLLQSEVSAEVTSVE